MRKILAKCALCAAPAACLSIASGVFAQGPTTRPEPALAPSSWMLQFRFQDPQRISVVEPGQAGPTVYWYMLYTVENATGAEVEFYPQFEIVTDSMQVVAGGAGVSPEAYRAIHRRANDPALLPPEQIAGRILQGKDRARHGVAIWKDFDAKAKSFTVYAGGLSGEVMRWKNPAFNPEQKQGPKNQKYFLLRKTLAIPYTLPGSEASRPSSTPRRVAEDQKWVMR